MFPRSQATGRFNIPSVSLLPGTWFQTAGLLNMKRDEFLHLFGFGATMLLTGCLGSCAGKTDNPQPAAGPVSPPVPAQPIDFTLDLADPANVQLTNPAFGYVYGAGGRVIVAKTTAGTYIALAAACTHQGTPVQFQPNANNFLCPNHGSQFNISGGVLNGPAAAPLRAYTVTQTGNTLRITA